MKSLVGVILALVVIASTAAFADDKPRQKKDAPASQVSAQTFALADGEVRKVDMDAQKITVRHGPLPDLDMPKPMTMVYRVKDASMLAKVKTGDKIKFKAENINGAFTLTLIEPVQ